MQLSTDVAASAPPVSPYEKKQDFNRITRFLHAFRQRHVVTIACALHDRLQRPVRIMDVGCSTGRTYEALNASCPISYVGIDLNRTSIAVAQARYATAANARFTVIDAADPSNFQPDSFDLVVALETLEHIPERHVVRIVENICGIVRPCVFVISVPVELGAALWIKTIGSRLMGYRRGSQYTMSQAFWAGLYNLNRVPTHGTKHVGFNWFWLEQTVRHNAPILETRSLPFRWLPKAMAPTVMFIASPEGALGDGASSIVS
jgi:SAM-dependent methyltransferase